MSGGWWRESLPGSRGTAKHPDSRGQVPPLPLAPLHSAAPAPHLQVDQLLHAGVCVASHQAERRQRRRQEEREQAAGLGGVPQLVGPRGGRHEAKRGARHLLALGEGVGSGGGRAGWQRSDKLQRSGLEGWQPCRGPNVSTQCAPCHARPRRAGRRTRSARPCAAAARTCRRMKLCALSASTMRNRLRRVRCTRSSGVRYASAASWGAHARRVRWGARAGNCELGGLERSGVRRACGILRSRCDKAGTQ